MKRTALFSLLFLTVLILIPQGAAAHRLRPGRSPDREPPRVQLVAPGFSSSGEFEVEVRAADPSGVARVFIAVRGEVVGVRLEEPYSFHLSVEHLPVEVCALADDRFGNSARECVTVLAPSACVMGVACEGGQWCNRPVGDCEGEGVCEPLLEGVSCTLDFSPVCGCDGVTYSNLCHAGLAGVSVDFIGPCAGEGP